MITDCSVTRMAGELCSELGAQSIPDDFQSGEYWTTIAKVRDLYTNYETLVSRLPGCPADCPIAAARGEIVGPGCTNYQFAHDMLNTGARWWAMRALDARRVKRSKAAGGDGDRGDEISSSAA